MPPKRKKDRPVTPGWVDTLIQWLEVIGVIGTILGGLYALYELAAMF